MKDTVKFRDSIALRYFVAVASVLIIGQLIFAIYVLYINFSQQRDDLYARALAHVNFLSEVTPDNVLANNFYPLETLMQQTAQEADFVYSIAIHVDGRLITNYLNGNDPLIQQAIAETAEPSTTARIDYLASLPNIIEVESNIIADDVHIGTVRLGYSTKSLNIRLRNNIISTLLWSGVLSLALAIVTIALFNIQIRNPLRNLSVLAAQFADGNLETRSLVNGKTEISQLQKSFNEMAAQIQENLLEMNKLTQVASRTNNAVIIADPMGRIEWVNQAFFDITGYTLEEVKGKTPGSVLQGEKSDANVIEYMREKIRKVEGFNTEIINYHKTGREYWIAVEVRPVLDEKGELLNFIAIETDITERKLSEARIRESEALKSGILNTALDAIISVNHRGEIIEFNPAAEAIFGYVRSDVIGKQMGHTIVPPHMRDGHHAGMSRYLETRQPRVLGQRIELPAMRADGSEFPAELAITSLEHEDEPIFTAHLRDITERKQAELALQESRDSLVVYAKELERSNRELQDFAYISSHDLQEPLRKIQAFGSRIESRYGDVLDDRGIDYIQRVQNAANRMQVLINDLLDFSRVTTKANEFCDVDLNETLKGVLSDLEIRVKETEAIIKTDELPVIEAEPLHMRQLLQNIIGNALKFHHPDRSPNVTITCDIARYQKGHEMVDIQIEDNGIGFDQKYADKIFTIFQRLHGKQEYEGTGIGLAVCRRIVEHHNGTIRVDSVEGEGTTFTIQLPKQQIKKQSST